MVNILQKIFVVLAGVIAFGIGEFSTGATCGCWFTLLLILETLADKK